MQKLVSFKVESQFLEFDTYRWREHCGPNYDNDIGYREESEFLYWKKKDPLKDFYTHNSKKYIDKKIQKINKEIDDAHRLADDANYPYARLQQSL